MGGQGQINFEEEFVKRAGRTFLELDVELETVTTSLLAIAPTTLFTIL
jgi:hypothetical protein